MKAWEAMQWEKTVAQCIEYFREIGDVESLKIMYQFLEEEKR